MAGAKITLMGHVLTHLAVGFSFFRLPGGEAVHITVVHTESSRDQDGIVDFLVSGAILPGASDVISGDLLAALLHLAGNRQQCF